MRRPRDRLAGEVVKQTPEQADRWSVLGVACYRAGDWTKAIEALEKSEALAPGQLLGYNALYLAMAYWRQQDGDKARQQYEQAINWLKKYKSISPDLLQLRDEAAQLLRLPALEGPATTGGK